MPTKAKIDSFFQVVQQDSIPAERVLAELLAIVTDEHIDEVARNLRLTVVVPEDISGIPQPAEILMTVHLGDTIKLEGRTETAQAFLRSHGAWWKVVSVHHPKAGHAPAGSRPPSWFLQSLPPNKQGGEGHKTLVNEWLLKDKDLKYRIIEVCASPTEFKYSNYKK